MEKSEKLKSPYFLVDTELLEKNLKVLRGVMDRTGCTILLAQKCFSCYSLYPMIGQYLGGATASGVYEARLWHEEAPQGTENHIFSPAFNENDFEEITRICDHIVFNSPQQLLKFGDKAKKAGMQVGIRINPEYSTQEGHEIYDPCSPGSRLGTTIDDFDLMFLEHKEKVCCILDGIHFHTLCEQDSEDLEETLEVIETKWNKYLTGNNASEWKPRWINFGGGHHITREGYDIPRLERCITKMQERYKLKVYIEPGEAVALNAGTLHTTVLEVQPEKDGVKNVILDTSAACHMPDVIEMPYTPPLLEAVASENGNYRFGGPTCLSGDIIGKYKIDKELHEGDELVFGDMAIYSMVKTNTFNGMPLPNIYIKTNYGIKLWKSFTYEDFKSRL